MEGFSFFFPGEWKSAFLRPSTVNMYANILSHEVVGNTSNTLCIYHYYRRRECAYRLTHIRDLITQPALQSGHTASGYHFLRPEVHSGHWGWFYSCHSHFLPNEWTTNRFIEQARWAVITQQHAYQERHNNGHGSIHPSHRLVPILYPRSLCICLLTLIHIIRPLPLRNQVVYKSM